MKRLNILFAMHFEPGHHVGTFRLAKQLQSRGHEIAYLGIPELRELVENQGFKFVPFAEDLLPPGYKDKTIECKNTFLSWWRKRRHAEAAFSEYLNKITDGTLDKCLLSSKADVLLCDCLLSYVAVRALSLGIPVINIFTSLFFHDNPDIPPVTMPIQPEDSVLSRIKVLVAWKLMRLKFLFTKRLGSLITGRYRSPVTMHHLVGVHLRIARKSGYRCEKNRTYWLNEIGIHLALPEIALCTKAFQFPGKLSDKRLYLGDFVDFERREDPSQIKIEKKPVIYCSLGTSASSYPDTDRFFQAIVEASKLKREWQFILHISDMNKIKNYKSSQNLLVLNWVPQLFLLKNASAMVTHGGLNSIMECIHFKVPMVIVPCLRDQPGNAARAAYHDIALTADIKDIEPYALIKLIEQAMDSKKIRNGLQEMKDKILAEGGLTESIDLIESLSCGKNI